jgi:predicted outer membrane repeat protein
LVKNIQEDIMKSHLLFPFFIFFSINISWANIIHVPGDYTTIQAGINASVNGDTVLIAHNTYPENINFNGKSIVVGSLMIMDGDTSHVSQTIIDGGGSSVNQSVVTFDHGETSLSRLVGLTLMNGYASGTHGGGLTITNNSHPSIEDCRMVNNTGTTAGLSGVGVYCNAASSPTFLRCFIMNNSPIGNGNYDHYGAGIYLGTGAMPSFFDCRIINNQLLQSIFHRNYGGGIYCNDSSPTFTNCEISENTADYGGGIQADNVSDVIFTNCIFDSNSVRHNGGAIYCGTGSTVQIDSCLFIKNRAQVNGGALFKTSTGEITAMHSTITDNRAGDDFEGLGAGLYAEPGTSPVLTDCIVFYNWSSEIYPADLSTISYCDVRGGYPGTGNFDYDPFFCNWVEGDYYIASNSSCLTGGSGGGQVGRYGTGCSAAYPHTIHVPGDIFLIQDAILASYQGDTILVDIGTYPENINFWGRRIILTSNYIHTGDISDISQTIIDGGGSAANQSVVTMKAAEDDLSSLIGLTLTNGYCSGSYGGGITLKNRSYPKIEDCRVTDNTGPSSSIRGVGIFCSASSPTIRHCLIKNNSPVGNGNYDHFGAGIYLSTLSSPLFENCQIIDNLLMQSIYHRNYGGAIYCDNSSPTFNNCEISGNTADHGGGIQAVNSSDVVLHNCIFDSNSVRHTGGAIYSGASAAVQVDSCLFVKNKAQENGGALYTITGGQITIQYSTLTDNRAGDDFERLGAGVYAESGTSPVLTDCIVFYNWSSEIYPTDLSTVNYCNVRGGYPGTGNFDYDPFFCNWIKGDYHIASNSLCVTNGSGGGQVGRYGAGCGAVFPQTIHVPGDTVLIQEAILASYQGDTVLVNIGTYPENINFWGRRIVLTSNYIFSTDTMDIAQTIIDGGGSTVNQSVVSFTGKDDSLCILNGLTLANGWASGSHGGGITLKNGSYPKIQNCWIIENSGTTQSVSGVGIYCRASSPTFEYCDIADNTITGNGNYDHSGGGVYIAAQSEPEFVSCKILDNRIAYGIYNRNYGGGVYCNNSAPVFKGCQFSGNTADYGGGIELINSSDAVIYNCYFTNNHVRYSGGAIYMYDSNPQMINNTMSRNVADVGGGAILTSNCNGVLMNLILWEDSAPSGAEIEILTAAPLNLTYSDIQGGWAGTGNIDVDPAFEDTINFFLSDTSQCIDAGNPDPAYYDPEDPMNPGFALWPAKGMLRNDMGAYGGPGTYEWIITEIETDYGSTKNPPNQFQLFQNYPNPFNPTTNISFEISNSADVRLDIYDILGRHVANLVNERLPAGEYKYSWKPENLPSGIYYYQLQAGDFQEVKKMILLK